jgi:Fe-S-cluster containining protein
MPGILCEHCTAACCRYIALPIETPTERSDFDDIRWYLLHENISVFVEDGEWYISILTNCRHVQADGRCSIYAKRPRICRKYTTETCDYHSGDYGWEAHFTCPEHLDEYVRMRFGKNNYLNKKCSQILDNPKKLNNSKSLHTSNNSSGKKTKAMAGARRTAAPAVCDLHGRCLSTLGSAP